MTRNTKGIKQLYAIFKWEFGKPEGIISNLTWPFLLINLFSSILFHLKIPHTPATTILQQRMEPWTYSDQTANVALANMELCSNCQKTQLTYAFATACSSTSCKNAVSLIICLQIFLNWHELTTFLSLATTGYYRYNCPLTKERPTVIIAIDWLSCLSLVIRWHYIYIYIYVSHCFTKEYTRMY